LEQSVPLRDGGARRQKAQAIAALCVGGLIVSRALRDASLARDLREASMVVALGLMDPPKINATATPGSDSA
jgi:TetR/AcrR family transcriptional regulator, transcriptional repressor for nem operon